MNTNRSMLSRIHSPSDLKELTEEEINKLIPEIRNRIIEVVGENGGHLASNLGMVEATVALHRVFNSPEDKIIFDVGHQCYTHKLLTGRADSFSSLRQFGGMSGFTNRFESDHDILTEGHSGSAISAALGIAEADAIAGKENYTIAIVGDGSSTNGMVYEALNNCTNKKINLIIIINDNEMSISKPTGAMHNYFNRLRTSRRYFRFKRASETFLYKIPVVGRPTAKGLKNAKDRLKRVVAPSNIIEDLGLIYLGPVNGNDYKKMIMILEEAKLKHQCCIIHMHTKKGRGYSKAEENAEKYHSVSAKKTEKNPQKTFSELFGESICSLAERDNKICAITAAMCDGTGLAPFRKKYADRFFDVGIAEEHAVTFAGGLSVEGMIPVVALYSTFSQRVYDQVFHDLAIQKLHVVIALDRAGIVQDDGITHQGIYDVALFSSVPGVRIFSPLTAAELDEMLRLAVYSDGVGIIRYSKGYPCDEESKMVDANGFFSHSENIENAKKVVITYGRIFSNVVKAVGDKAGIIRLKKVFPFDFEGIYDKISEAEEILFVEEGIRSGGIAEKFAAALCCAGYKGKYKIHAIKDFVGHGSVESLYEEYGFSVDKLSGLI